MVLITTVTFLYSFLSHPSKLSVSHQIKFEICLRLLHPSPTLLGVHPQARSGGLPGSRKVIRGRCARKAVTAPRAPFFAHSCFPLILTYALSYRQINLGHPFHFVLFPHTVWHCLVKWAFMLLFYCCSDFQVLQGTSPRWTFPLNKVSHWYRLTLFSAWPQHSLSLPDTLALNFIP